MSDRVMLEASMFVHRDSLNQLKGITQANALGEVAVSDALVRLFEFDTAFATHLLGKYYAIPEQLIDPEAIRDFFKLAVSKRVLDSSEPRDLIRYRRSSFVETPSMYMEILGLTGNEWLTQVIFEEWEFLTTQSWLFSRARKAYETMIAAGATAVEVSKKRLETVVRATIKKEATQPITTSDSVRAIAKWVAVGGSSATSFVEPLTGAAMSAATGLFLLYDP